MLMKLGLVVNHREKRKMAKDKFKIKDEKEFKKLLEKAQSEITEYAKKLVKDYTKNPSDMSGSMVTVHQNSPLLKKDK